MRPSSRRCGSTGCAPDWRTSSARSTACPAGSTSWHFEDGQRHVIEIDGPSHYTVFDEVTHTYSPDEAEYARNLRIERWLRSENWEVTRIGRHEVREAMAEKNIFGKYDVVGVLPLAKAYPPTASARSLGLWEIDFPVTVAVGPTDDDIPF